ncbi:hypothetical protein NL676_006806 [Syzygium grande]|nr:hypothetical protein NL676_006806 [Syzygium grande]
MIEDPLKFLSLSPVSSLASNRNRSQIPVFLATANSVPHRCPRAVSGSGSGSGAVGTGSPFVEPMRFASGSMGGARFAACSGSGGRFLECGLGDA